MTREEIDKTKIQDKIMKRFMRVHEEIIHEHFRKETEIAYKKIELFADSMAGDWKEYAYKC